MPINPRSKDRKDAHHRSWPMRACHYWVAAIALVACEYVFPSLANNTAATSSADLVTSVEITYPVHGAFEKAPLTFKTRVIVSPDQVGDFRRQSNEMHLCIETSDLNRARNSTRACSPIDGSGAEIQHREPGNFTAFAYITANLQILPSIENRHWKSKTTAFAVVSDADFDARITSQVQEAGKAYPDFDLGLVEWATQQQQRRNGKLVQQLGRHADTFDVPVSMEGQDDEKGGDLVLVMGIKTAVATNFAIRQAIRQTWASKDTLPSGVKVFFLGCRPFAAATGATDSFDDGNDELRRIWDAIQLEKLVYGDLLTDELDCDDSYPDLAKKVTEFMHFTATHYPRAQYVLIADDDLYVRMDKIVDKLTSKAPRARFYSGQVRAIENGQTEQPNRVNNGKLRYFLTEEQYPMAALPPFAIGAYFFLSMDCVHFISKNRGRLSYLAGMDDMSVALWMLTIQVHARPFNKLEHLRGGPCADNLVALGDLSPLSIRIVHDNLLERRGLCHGFDYHLWMKPRSLSPRKGSERLPNFTETLEFEFLLHDLTVAYSLEIEVVLSTRSQAGIKVSYFLSLETQLNFFLRICGIARLNFPGVTRNLSCLEITRQAKHELQTYYKQLHGADIVDRSRVELWRYNLLDADMYRPPFIVAYAPSATFSRVVLECLFVSVFEDQHRPVLVIPENILHQYYGGSPDVFVFSVLGGKCNPASQPACREMVASYFERYINRNQTNTTTTTTMHRSTELVMITGEAWSTDGLDERVLLVSTVAKPNRTKHIHLSMASVSFAERLDHGPLSLLSTSESRWREPKSKFCAYLYAHCEWRNRELMYDILNALRPVDALGKCAGSSRPPDLTKMASREALFYNDDAVRRYGPYKFVIAFENTRAAGYVTEKMVNAFLAGSVPVFLGDTATVANLFNPESFIDCGRFVSLQECAKYVVEVDDTPELYTRIIREPPVINLKAFYEAFSWHPTIPSRFTAYEVLKHFTTK